MSIEEEIARTVSLRDLPRGAGTIYARPWGEQQWGYYSGAMYWDAAYLASHTNHENRSAT